MPTKEETRSENAKFIIAGVINGFGILPIIPLVVGGVGKTLAAVHDTFDYVGLPGSTLIAAASQACLDAGAAGMKRGNFYCYKKEESSTEPDSIGQVVANYFSEASDDVGKKAQETFGSPKKEGLFRLITNPLKFGVATPLAGALILPATIFKAAGVACKASANFILDGVDSLTKEAESDAKRPNSLLTNAILGTIAAPFLLTAVGASICLRATGEISDFAGDSLSKPALYLGNEGEKDKESIYALGLGGWAKSINEWNEVNFAKEVKTKLKEVFQEPEGAKLLIAGVANGLGVLPILPLAVGIVGEGLAKVHRGVSALKILPGSTIIAAAAQACLDAGAAGMRRGNFYCNGNNSFGQKAAERFSETSNSVTNIAQETFGEPKKYYYLSIPRNLLTFAVATPVAAASILPAAVLKATSVVFKTSGNLISSQVDALSKTPESKEEFIPKAIRVCSLPFLATASVLVATPLKVAGEVTGFVGNALSMPSFYLSNRRDIKNAQSSLALGIGNFGRDVRNFGEAAIIPSTIFAPKDSSTLLKKNERVASK